MSPDGLITSEFDDAAIIDADASDDTGDDANGLADLEVVVLGLLGTAVVVDGMVEQPFELAAGGGVRAAPGAEGLIRRLRASGVAVALTTGLSRGAADAVLDTVGWRDLPVLALTPAEGRVGPYPDLPLTALLRVGASRVEGMVVVGDSTADIASGLAAGAGLVVGVLTGSNDERALTAAGADVVIPSVADLAGLLGLDERERAEPFGAGGGHLQGPTLP